MNISKNEEVNQNLNVFHQVGASYLLSKASLNLGNEEIFCFHILFFHFPRITLKFIIIMYLRKNNNYDSKFRMKTRTIRVIKFNVKNQIYLLHISLSCCGMLHSLCLKLI